MADKKPVEKQVYNTKEERLAALRSKGRSLNKSLGIQGITVASDLVPWKRAAFGISELDSIIGGGIPHGNFTTLWGGPGCGKTSAAFKLAATAQKEGKIVYWIALEPFDAVRAAQFGVNLNELMIGQFPQAEQALDTIIDYSRDKLVDVIILDSIHSLSPKGEQENSKGEKSVGDDTMALLARKLSQFFKMAIDPIKRAEVAVLLIGQTRMQVGFISIEALTGGNALHHFSKLIIRNRRGAKDEAPTQKIKNEETGKTEESVIGFNGVFKLEKVQVPGAKTEGTVMSRPYYFESGYDLPQYILDENAQIEKATSGNNVEEESAPLSETNPYAKDKKALKRSVISSTKIETPDFDEGALSPEPKKKGRPKKS